MSEYTHQAVSTLLYGARIGYDECDFCVSRTAAVYVRVDDCDTVHTYPQTPVVGWLI